MDEKFAFTSYRSRTAVYVDGRLKYLDNRRLTPENTALDGIGFFEGYTHTGSAYFYGGDRSALDNMLPLYTSWEAAVSASAAGISVRAAGNCADDMYRLFENMTRTLQ